MNILRLLAVSLISILLIPINVSAHCKGKHTGNHPHCDDGGDNGSGEYTGSDGVAFINPSDVGAFDYHIIGTPGRDTITAGSGTDLIEGGGDSDNINALGGNDEIHGGDGDDVIDAGDGDDQVFGGAGADSLFGGAGTDFLDGGDGVDALEFGSAAQLTIDPTMSTYIATVTDPFDSQGQLLNIEDIWGTRGNDVLYGSDGTDNFIYGSEGDDVIHGLGGNDTLIGGQGNDEVYGGPGDDWVGGEPGADLVVGGPGNDTVSGAESGAGDLTDDELWGGDNEDLVDGENDTFHFRREFGTDTIMDYEQDETIHLNGYIGGFWRNDLTFDVININEAGDDIVVSFWLKRGGGTGGTIILKGAAAKGIVVDDSDFIID